MGSPGALIKKIDALEAGTTKDIIGKATVTVLGVAMTAAQINAKLGTADTLYAAVANAKTALKAALAAWDAAVPGLKAFIKSYEGALKGVFGADGVQLLDFGINPVKPPVRSAEEKAVSAALAKRTRGTRGTLGKNQRESTTTQGKPGLVLVDPSGTPIPGGLVTGPTPPGATAPVDAAANLAPVGSSTAGNDPNGGAATPPGGSNTPAK
jgi:hypothetical protein